MLLSPYVEKTFNSKVIKSFVPELRSRKCFFFFFFFCFVSGFLCYLCMSYEHSMYISHIHVWLCNILAPEAPQNEMPMGSSIFLTAAHESRICMLPIP